MNIKNIEKKEKNYTVLTIEVDAKTFEEACMREYRKKVGTMHIPGFRKGKAPRKLVESMYGKGVFYEGAVNDTYRAAYDEAIERENLEPVESPDVEIVSIGEEGYSFTAGFHVYPVVEIGEYKGLKAVMPAVEDDESKVDEEIARLRERNAALVTVDRPAAKGDTVIFDYEGLLEDVPFEGGSAEQSSLELGSGRFIPGFEEKLEGVSSGEERDIDLRFPEEYHAEHLAGKEVRFRCKIHEVKEKQLPELDDEFAKDVSEFDTLEEFRESIRARLRSDREKEANDAFENALIDQLIAGLVCDVPDCMVEARVDSFLMDFETRLRRSRMDLNTYCSMTGQTVESLRNDQRGAALRQVQTGLIFDEIARRENMIVDEAEMDAEYARLAEIYKLDAAEIKERIDQKAMRQDLLALKASRLVVDSAERLSSEDSAEPKPSEDSAAEPAKAESPKTASKSAKPKSTAKTAKPKADKAEENKQPEA